MTLFRATLPLESQHFGTKNDLVIFWKSVQLMCIATEQTQSGGRREVGGGTRGTTLLNRLAISKSIGLVKEGLVGLSTWSVGRNYSSQCTNIPLSKMS